MIDDKTLFVHLLVISVFYGNESFMFHKMHGILCVGWQVLASQAGTENMSTACLCGTWHDVWSESAKCAV
jgi:hypothetical protein